MKVLRKKAWDQLQREAQELREALDIIPVEALSRRQIWLPSEADLAVLRVAKGVHSDG